MTWIRTISLPIWVIVLRLIGALLIIVSGVLLWLNTVGNDFLVIEIIVLLLVCIGLFFHGDYNVFEAFIINHDDRHFDYQSKYLLLRGRATLGASIPFPDDSVAPCDTGSDYVEYWLSEIVSNCIRISIDEYCDNIAFINWEGKESLIKPDEGVSCIPGYYSDIRLRYYKGKSRPVYVGLGRLKQS